MIQNIIPNKLQKGDEVRIIAPSLSLARMGQDLRNIARHSLEELGFKVSFGKHAEERDDFDSSSIESRIADLHEAFSDQNVKAVFAAMGGFNCNQLLDYIDWDIISGNPKIFCGHSDITALNNSFFAKTGLVAYSGMHYSGFSQKRYFDYSFEYFKKCLLVPGEFEIVPSKEWINDKWCKDQDSITLIPNEGFWVLKEGQASGTILGGNLCTFNLLQGTPYMPDLKGAVLFVEDDHESQPHHFDRDLQSLMQMPGFKEVRGIVIGRFQKESNMTRDLLEQIIESKNLPAGIPVIANADFGHTYPKITFPVGGTVKVAASGDEAKISIVEH